MAKRSSTRSRSKQGARNQYRAKIEKLQKAGLIGKVDFRKKASPATLKTIDKYKGLIGGKETAVRTDTVKQAAALRKKFGFKGTGKTVIVPREKGERFKVTPAGDLSSVRPNPVDPGTKIKKTFGEKFATPPARGDRLYYTLPERKRGMGRVKRTTFASFDEMLFYLNSYDINFDDVEDYIEIEEVVSGGERDTSLRDKIADERHKRYLAKKRKNKKTRTTTHKERRGDAKIARLKKPR